MNNPLVSIIITLHNYEKYISDCIESCLAQTYKNKEIWIVDDCSTDGSFYIIDEYRNNYPDIHIWRHRKNRGIAASKNTGIKCSNGELITFIDADDMLTPDSIEKRVKEMQKMPKCDFMHAQAYHVEGNYTYQECLKKKFRIHGKLETINAQTMMIKRKVFEKYGMFYSIHSKEDKMFTWTLGIHPSSPLPKLVKSFKLLHPCAFYRVHHDSAKHSRTSKDKIKLMKQFNKRIRQIKKQGITFDNTEFLSL